MKAIFDFFYLETPLGCLKISTQDHLLVGITLVEHSEQIPPCSVFQKDITLQLMEYFDLKRKTFQIPIRFIGTSFQQNVWSALSHIPFGTLTTYKKIAEIVGCSKGFRAVGQAIHRNPIAIVVPCHRVVGENGTLIGYAYGLDRKRYLINLEQNFSPIFQ